MLIEYAGDILPSLATAVGGPVWKKQLKGYSLRILYLALTRIIY